MLRHRRSLSAFYLPAVCGLLFSSSLARANPTGAQVVNGAVGMETIGNTLKITAPDRSIIHWQNFSIGAGETTQFIQPGSMATVLNRVTSGEASQLMGTLQANGRVYLLNPNGIFIGNGAVVDVGSFMATTAHLTDEAFLKGGDFQLTGASDAPIRNAGTITARNGDVFLLAQVVENRGTIRAAQGTVGLMAGRDFYVKKEEAGSVKVMVNASQVPGAKKGIGVDQRGTIEALRANLEADGNAYALAINQAGVVRATGVNQMADGTVALSAPGGKILNSGQIVAANQNGSGGKISVSGTEVVFEAASMVTAAGAVDGGEIKVASDGDNLIRGRLSVDGATGKAGRIQLTGERIGLLGAKVSADGATGGGEVLVGGDYLGMNSLVRNAKATVMARDSVISADGTMTGDGGKVIVWSDEYTGFYGDISAQGGSVSGNGGFIETSSKINLQAMGSVSASAFNGQGGLWLLDPADLTITAANNNITAATPFQPVDPDLATSTLNSTTLRNALVGGDVEIRTTAGGGTGTGLITFAAWTTPNINNNRTLTVTSVGGITVNNGVTIVADSNDTHALSLIFDAATGVSFNGNASLDLNGGNFTSSGTTFSLGTGTITTTAQVNSMIASGAIQLDHSSDITLGGSLVTTGANHNNGDASAGGAVTITASGAATIQVDGSINTSGGNNGDNNHLGGNAGSVSFNTANQNILLDGATITATGGSGATRGLGGTITFSDQVLLQTAATTLISGTTGVAGGGSILFSSTLDGAQNLSLTAGTGNITFTGAVGATRLGAVTVVSGATVQALSTFRAASFTQSAGTVATTLSGLVDLTGALDFTGQILNLNGVGANVVGTTMDVTNAGLFTTATGSNLTVGNEFVQDGAGLVQLGGDLASTNDGFSFATGVTLNSGISLSTGLGAGDDIRFNGTLNGTQTLAFTAGAGSITFTGAVGGAAALGAVTINTANNVGISSTFRATSFNQAAVGAGTFTLGGALTATTGNVTIQSATVTLNAVVEATLGDISVRQTTGTLDLDVTAGLVAGGNNIDLFAQNINVTAAFGDATDVITLTALDNRTIGLGDTAGDLTLTGAELQRITGNSLELITTGAGTITVNNITAGNSNNAGTVILDSTGNISFSATASVFNAVTAESDGAVNVSVAVTTDTGAISLTGATGIQLGANLTTSGGSVSLNSATTLTADATVDTTNAGGSAAGANITFGAGISGAAFNLGLDAGTGGAISATTVSINNLTLSNGASAAFTGAVTVNDLITTANAYTVSLTGSGNTFTQNVDFENTGVGAAVTLGDNATDTFLFNGGLSFTGNVAANVGAIIRSSGDVINFGTGGVTLVQNSTVDTTNAGGSAAGAAITFGAAVDGAGQDLNLATGAGSISVTGAVGGNAPNQLGNLTIASNGTVTFNGTLDIGAFSQTGTGSTTFNANLETGAGFSFGGNELTFFAGSGDNVVGGDMTISNTGTFTLDLGATLASAGIFDQNGVGVVSLGGDVSSADAMTFRGDLTLTATVELQNAAGNVELQGTVNGTAGTEELTVIAVAEARLDGGLGGTVSLASLAVTGSTISLNGGEVTTSGSGGQAYTGAVTLGAATTLTTVDNDVTFTGSGSTISGAQALVIDAGTGMVTLGGAVGTGALTALASLDVTGATIAINGGGVRTAGLQSYTGAVTLGDDTALTTTDSDVTFTSTIRNPLAQTLTIAAGTGLVTFGGAVGGGATALQSLEVTGVGGNIQMDGGAVTTVGLQNYAGTVDLGVDTTLTTAGGDITFGAGIGTSAARDLTMETGAGDIRVAGSVGSNADELGALAIVSAKDVTFEGTVDVGTFAQSSGAGTTQFEANLETGGDFSFTGLNLIFLTASANNTIGGDMDVSMSGALTTQSAANLQAAGNFTQTGAGLNSLGGDVFAGAINFSSGITLTANGILLQTATGDVVLQGTIQGPHDLTVTSAGDVTLGGAVGTGALAALNSLAVTGDTIAIHGGGVRTTGAAGQVYTGAVTLGGGAATITLTTSDDLVTFAGAGTTINNAKGLIILAGGGTVTFGGAVGGATPLTSLAVTGGTIAINGGGVTTDGTAGQVYTGAVILGDDTLLTTSNDPLLFAGAGTVSGGKTLEIAAGTGTVTFGGGVGTGALAALVSLEVTGGTIAINGNGVRTTGAAGQLYTGAVTVGSSATLSTSDDAVTFAGAGTVNGPGTLEILAGSAAVTFGGALGGANPLASLAVTGGTIAIEGGEITTAGVQLYTGAVTLGADTRLATTDSALSFSSTIQNATARALEIVAGTGVVTFAGAVGGGATALESLEVSAGGIAIQGGSVRTSGAGGQIYDGAVSASTVSFAASAGSIDLRNNGNDFTGSVTILSGNAITLIDANALSLAGAATSAGQVFVAGGSLSTTGAYAISGTGDLLLKSQAGQVTLGAGTSYTGRNVTVVAGENQSFINQAGADPFLEMGGRTLVFSSKAKINSPSQLDGGFTGFQPYFNTVPEVVLGPALGTYTVLNALPGGNLMVYRPPGSSPVHPDHVSQATVNSIVNTEAFQTTVPIITYSLLSLPRSAVKIRYRMAPDQAGPVSPLGLGRRTGEARRPSAEAQRRQSNDLGGFPKLPAGKDPVFHLGEISIQGARVSFVDDALKNFPY